MDGVLFLIVITAVAAGWMARFEGRSLVLWTGAGILAAPAAAWLIGAWAFLTPVVVLVPAYLVLWVMSLRDDRALRKRPRGGVVSPRRPRGDGEGQGA